MRADQLDLRELLAFKPTGGVLRFLGRRAVLFDAVALGLLRKELVEAFGEFAARGVLTRLGYAHGWRTAQALQEEHPDLWAEGKAGPLLPALAGQFVVGHSHRSDGSGEAPLVESIWKESYEAEQHLLHFGRAEGPACWTTAGFASGYVSYKEGREVYFIEDRCVAKGDPTCHVVARFREQWGPELEPHLAYYRMQSIDEVLHGVNAKLKRAERKLREREKALAGMEVPAEDPSGIVARSEAMRRTLDRARRFARTDSSVLVTGESGVGKEVLSRLIHAGSGRAKKPFISVNCGAIPETLLESELFGHAKGAFTGAHAAAMGLFEAASGGTLLLDEVGEITPAMQVKLLRVLQEKEIRRVGEQHSRPVDTRIIAATNRDLAQEVAAGRFRRDLYYRLHVIELAVPPLRERTEDILPLARFFVRKLAAAMNRPATGLAPKVADRFLRYAWPGNVRELQSTIESALALCEGAQVTLDDLPDELRDAPRTARHGAIRPLDDVEREHILAAVRATNGDKNAAARALGIGIATLYRKLKAFGATSRS